jgi:cullin 3
MLGGRNRPKVRAPRQVSCALVLYFPPGLRLTAVQVSSHTDFNKIWKSLEASFQHIHSKNASRLRYEELYRGTYQLVVKNKGEELYNNVVEFERKWLRDTVQKQASDLITADLLTEKSIVSAERRHSGERFLKVIKQQWGDHELGAGMVSDVTMYLVCWPFQSTTPR